MSSIHHYAAFRPSCGSAGTSRWIWSLSVLLLLPALLTAQFSSILPQNTRERSAERAAALKERQRLSSSSILSVTATRHEYKFGRLETKGLTESVKRYTAAGHLAEVATHSPVDGTVQTRTTYRYDQRGNLVEENLFQNGDVVKTVHRYTAGDLRRETIHYRKDGSVEKKVSYVYDDHGFLLETAGVLDDGRPFLRETFLYDTKGLLAERKNSLTRWTYQYDARGNAVGIVRFGRVFRTAETENYQLTDRYEFQYDRRDLMTSALVLRPDSTVKARYEFQYDAEGRLTGEKEFGADKRPVYSRKIVIASDGRRLEESGSERGRFFRSTYRYDSRGNVTEATEYDQINEPRFSVRYSYGRSGAVKSVPSNRPADTVSFTAAGADEFETLIGGKLVAPDGAFLGLVIADTTDSQSIVNTWGQYGSFESPTSIFNASIPYGGKDGVFSPFNPASPSPPSIYKEGRFYAYCTENENFRPRVSPRQLIAFLLTRFPTGKR